MRKLKEFLMVLLTCVIICEVTACGGGDSYSEFTWPDNELGKILPQPNMTLKGKITINSDDMLIITIAKVSSDDFDSYVELCKDEGFVLETFSTDSYYSANNELGYKLLINYDEKEKTMRLDISGNNAYGEFEWPNSEIAKLIPVPKSSYGSIDWEASYGFVIYVAETSIDDFNEYVDSCKECGFTFDYRAGDDFYYADNENGYKLTLNYEEGDVMFIRLDEPDEETQTSEEATDTVEPEDTSSTEETNSTEDTSQVSDSEIRPEFKEAMDSYETFFDEYVEFMKKYQESDDVTSMLMDYANYMSQYADMMSKLGALEDEDMTTAEAAYYLEVTVRINKKLLELAQ